jgi:hypothetical protein
MNTLPPLPEPEGRYQSHWDGFKQCWVYYSAYSKKQLQADRESVVRLCAQIAAANGEDEPYGHAKFRCAHIEQEILALLNTEGHSSPPVPTQAPTSPAWIPVSERLPGGLESCDWLFPSNGKLERWMLCGESIVTASVPGRATHWRPAMPLPAPPVGTQTPTGTGQIEPESASAGSSREMGEEL